MLGLYMAKGAKEMLMSVHGIHTVLLGTDCHPDAQGWQFPAPTCFLNVLVGH